MVRLTVNQCDLGANTNAVINEVIIGNSNTLLFSLYTRGGGQNLKYLFTDTFFPTLKGSLSQVGKWLSLQQKAENSSGLAISNISSNTYNSKGC